MQSIKRLINQQRNTTLSWLKHAKAEDVVKRFDEAIRLADTFGEVRRNAEKDARLTQKGKDDAIAKAVNQSRGEIDTWETSECAGLDAHAEQLRAELLAKVTPKRPIDVAERIEEALLRADVRRAAADLTDQQREVLYRTSSDSNVRRALEELPSISKTKDGGVVIKPYITDEVREEVLLDAGRRQLPEVAERLDDIAEIRGVVKAVAGMFREKLRDAAPALLEGAPVVVK